MIDLRYHLASIVAIFFALGLGMLMGAQLADEGTLTQEHARLIEQIESSVERVRADNRRLGEQLADVQARLTAEQTFIDDMLAHLVSDRLGGVPVDLVVTTGSASYDERVLKALQQAGADVSVWEETPVAILEKGPAITLFLWGEAEGPGVGVGADAAPGSEAMVGAASDTNGEEATTFGDRLTGTVWGWPSAAAAGSGLSATDGVHIVEAVDTPTGLMTLIDVLRSKAGLESSGFEANRP